MKKTAYIFTLLAFLLLSVASCDVTRKPKATPEQSPFTSMQDVTMNRDAVYALLGNTESPNMLNYPDYMSDLFQVTLFDTGLHHTFYSWNKDRILDHEWLVDYYFYNYYSLVQANYFIMRVEEYIANEEIKKSSDEQNLLKQYLGEAKVVRALAHWRIIQRFSRPWHEGDVADRTKGIIVMDKYSPMETAKENKRSRQDVYKSIYEDLDYAIANIPAEANKNVQPAIYITQDFAYAVKARAALTREDWQVAQECSQWIIDRYPLQPKEQIGRLWVTEDSPEILVRLFASPALGGIRANLYGGGYTDRELEDGRIIRHILHNPSMVLAQWVVDLYEENDARNGAFIDKQDFFFMYPLPGREDDPNAKLTYTSIAKYKGNPSLNKSADRPEFKFGIHLFNAGEAYLINSEASLKAGDFAGAISSYEKLRTARGVEVPEDARMGNDFLLDFLKKERVLELVGEGFRMDDLVRWGDGMKRNPKVQPTIGEAILENGINLEVQPDNKMMIWEFPTRDINNNDDLSANRNW